MEEIRDVFGKVILELGKKDERIIVLDADLGSSTRANMFSRIPGRFIQCGIAEQNMVGVSAGLALKGLIPVAVSFSVFLAGRCYDQIRVSVAYPNLNVKLVGSHAGLTTGPDGPTHQAIEDIALMRALPNMMVLEPADRNEMAMVIKESIKYYGPVYIRMNRGSSPDIYTSAQPRFKKINVLKDGKDIAIIASGFMVHKALMAAKLLESEQVDALVADMHCIKPADVETLVNIAKKVRFIVTVENHSVIGGLGSTVCEIISDLHIPVFKIGLNDTFAESAETEDLFKKYGLTEFDIVQTVKRNMHHLKS